MTTATLTIAQARAALVRLDACSDAREWLDGYRGSVRRAWVDCERGDWMLWLAARVGVDRRLVVLAACDCAEAALIHVPAGEDRPRTAIETTRRWARGRATIAEVRAAADAYDAASYAADAYDAAADAADAADAASYASYAAAYAAHAAAATTATTARSSSPRASAEIVRRHIPTDVIVTALRGAL